MRKGELDIDLMPEREVKRILKEIVNNYLSCYRDTIRVAASLDAELIVEGLVCEEKE